MTSLSDWTRFLDEHIDSAAMPITPLVKGQLTRVTGLTLKAQGLKLALGSICHIEQDSGEALEAEVVGFDDRALYLMPTSDTLGLLPGARICAKITPRPPPVVGKPHPPRRRSEDRLRSLPIGRIMREADHRPIAQGCCGVLLRLSLRTPASSILLIPRRLDCVWQPELVVDLHSMSAVNLHHSKASQFKCMLRL